MKTTKFICKNCKKEFNQPKTIYDSKKTVSPTAYEQISVCPYCNCSGFEETEELPSKRQLKQYIHLKREIEAAEIRLSKMDKNSSRYCELYEMIENNKLRCMALLIKLQGFIYSIDDSLLRQIFELRYIEGLKWAAVAYKLGAFLSEDYARILHDRYLNKK